VTCVLALLTGLVGGGWHNHGGEEEITNVSGPMEGEEYEGPEKSATE